MPDITLQCRDDIEQAKKNLLHAIFLALEASAKQHGFPMALVEESIRAYGENMVDDFFYERLCEIADDEERVPL